MRFMNFLKRPDINQGVEEWQKDHGAVLLDVRTDDEYCEGHIEGSVNIPLQKIEEMKKRIPDRNRHIYIHCLSGARSAQAVSALKSMGYTDVKDIGGISSYCGKVVK